MKFAKELDDGRVAEWQSQYFDYKQGKKKIKAVTRAVKNAGGRQWRTPRQMPERSLSQNALTSAATPIAISAPNRASDDEAGAHRVGSIVGSPVSDDGSMPTPSRPASLNLGDPALDMVDAEHAIHRPRRATIARGPSSTSGSALPSQTPPTTEISAYEVGKTKHPSPMRSSLRRALTSPRHGNDGGEASERALFKQILSRHSSARFSKSPVDIPLEVQREIDTRKDEFSAFLNKELSKIEDFYKMKEQEALARMELLVSQLHLLRDHRMRDLEKEEHEHARKASKAQTLKDGQGVGGDETTSKDQSEEGPHRLRAFYGSISSKRHVHFHKSRDQTGDKTADLMTPPGLQATNARMDHERKPLPTSLSYSHAKRKLRAALQEFYRGLELLKSYVLLNRTAFRKINKKYDKAVRTRPYMGFMAYVNDAHFVQSDILDSQLHQIEDLYTRYFERGNRKVAVAKLRRRGLHGETYHRSTFWDGLSIAGGLIFGIQGLVYAVELLFDNPSGSELQLNTSYLLQLYAGYFLVLLLMLYFCIICAIFDQARVNYVFIFEFDARHHLNWRQLAELPCTLFFLLGLVIWLNFSQFGGETMYIYYPVVLIGLSLVILGFPANFLYHRSRFWLWKTFLRVAFASGLVSVHFGDLILGDMFNSLTYSVGNVELFFCLYARRWDTPDQCNSSHSKLFGFFQTLPGIWRLFQCLRRFHDSRSPWPHLANAGKYTCSILAYMTLSIWRIDRTMTTLAIFILFSCLNTLYTWIWDVMMDWSLFTLSKKHRGLRDMIAYKAYTYYVAILVDFVLRSSWIFYVIFRRDSQHSSIVSFAIAFVEVFRRAGWTAFRVENDHCYNILTNKAVREVGLPYKLERELDHVRSAEAETDTSTTTTTTSTSTSSEPGDRTPRDVESGAASVSSGASYNQRKSRDTEAMNSLRRRQTNTGVGQSPSIRSRVGHLMSSAHAQDFERTKAEDRAVEEEEDDEDDEDDEEGLDNDERELQAYKDRTRNA